MSTKKIEEALRVMGTAPKNLEEAREWAELQVAARAELEAIKKAAVSHVQNRRLWRKIEEESK